MDPLISVMPMARRRSRGEMEAIDAERGALLDDMVRVEGRGYMPRMEAFTSRPGYRRAMDSGAMEFVPGRGYVPVRELVAEGAVSMGRPLGERAGEYAHAPMTPLLNQLSALGAAYSTVEGALAGLSSDTPESQGFLDPLQRGLSTWADPSADMSAVHDRLYRHRDGTPMHWAEGFAASNVLGPFARMGRRPAFGTQLVDRHGNVIRQLRAAEPVMPLGLPAPAY